MHEKFETHKDGDYIADSSLVHATVRVRLVLVDLIVEVERTYIHLDHLVDSSIDRKLLPYVQVPINHQAEDRSPLIQIDSGPQYSRTHCSSMTMN